MFHAAPHMRQMDNWFMPTVPGMGACHSCMLRRNSACRFCKEQKDGRINPHVLMLADLFRPFRRA